MYDIIFVWSKPSSFYRVPRPALFLTLPLVISSLSPLHYFHSIITILPTKIMQVGHSSNSASFVSFTPTPADAVAAVEHKYELVL